MRDILHEVDRARIEGSACVIAHMRPELEDPQPFAFVLHCAIVGGQWPLDDSNDPRIPAILKTAHRSFGLDEKATEGEG